MNDMANSPMNSSLAPERIDFNTPALQRKRRIRALKDRLTRWYVLVGGLAVLAAITLIFFYLAYVVLPLFRGADLETREALTPAWMQQAQVPLLLSIEEQNQVAMRVGGQGEILFFNAKTGVELKRVALPLPAGSEIRSIAQDQPGSPTVALGLSNGQVLVFQHTYKVTYPDNKKTITPEIAFPYGETPIGLDPQGRPLEHVSINAGDDSLLLAGSVDKQLLLLSMTREENMLTGESTLDEERIELPQIAALDEKGNLGVFHSTAHRTLLVQPVADSSGVITLSPRANRLLLEQGGKIHRFALSNPHPEISWSALWGKVWYESYDKPAYVWQSTAATTDFEPKLSLSPLTFGTLKAAFYAMILAAPLAIAAAVYTAYFMAPAMRRKVKPVIELMEALPTVILGFFAGLFLAPYVEGHLPGVFSLLLLTPLGILLAGLLWSRLPERIRLSLPAGWEAALLIPVVLAVGAFALWLSPHLETTFFGGDMRLWLSHDLGITYDQRNALIVGLAMGFAVIPNIFSIAEDAIFSVPRSLTYGSLALGATPWQTLTRVVILTASPGIFSALMIGMGRAVGETMIVLMATGNTPVMELNIFEGMRTLAANVAVEMPESEVGGSHYRVLFLSALVLLTFTFVMNTLAELIRQRLRKKYASL